MKIYTPKAEKILKLTLSALLLIYAIFFLYGGRMAYNFCNGPSGPADPYEESACFKLNHGAYQRIPLLIDHPEFDRCSFSRIKYGNYWDTLDCLNDKQNHGIFSPMDDVESECTFFKSRSYSETLECIATNREAKEWVSKNKSNPYYTECINHWTRYSEIEMCMKYPVWRH